MMAEIKRDRPFYNYLNNTFYSNNCKITARFLLAKHFELKKDTVDANLRYFARNCWRIAAKIFALFHLYQTIYDVQLRVIL